MEHVVFFSESSGDSAFRRVADLEEAVRLVESLRNERGITDVALHALTPVPVSFRTYYRVEVGVEVAPEPAEATDVQPQPVPSVESAEPVPSVAVPSLEEELVESPALHLLPPPVLEAEVGVEGGDEVEVARVEQSDEESVPERVQVERVEVDQDVDFAAFSLEHVAEASPTDLEPDLEADFEFEAPQIDAAEESVDDFAAFGSYEPLVPQVRPESDAERSLGYFAR